MQCEQCNSENTYFSKKKQRYVCRDCGYVFAPNKREKNIFISYAHGVCEDFISAVIEALKNRHRLNVWVDTCSIKSGEDWRREITIGIKNSTTVIAFLSEKAITSPGVCLDELQIAVTYNKHIIPIRLQEVALPSSISYRQWYDVPNVDFEIKVQNVIEYILSRLEKEGNMTDDMAELEKALCPNDFTSKLKLISSHEYIKRNWLINITDNWLQSSKRFLWVCGKPGTGKSIYSIQLYFERPYIGAIFFCEWDKRNDISAGDVIRNLSFQLALRDENYREIILTVLNSKQLTYQNPIELFEVLFINPFNIMIDGQRPIITLVVDALDELNADDAQTLLQLVYTNQARLPQWVKFIFTTRPVRDFEAYSSTADSKRIEFNLSTAKEDIKAFVWHRLKGRVFPQRVLDRVATRITENSDGIFLYAEEVVKDICSGIIAYNDEIPSGLDFLFRKYFERAVRDDPRGFKEAYSPIIATILAARRNISPKFISKILDISENEVEQKLKNFSDYFVLLTNEKENEVIIKPYHKMITDWILGLNRYDKFYCNVDEIKDKILLYGLNCVKEKKYFDDYYVTFFYDDLITSAYWLKITHEEKVNVYLHVIRSATLLGDIEAEHKMLQIMGTDTQLNHYEKCAYLSRKINFESRHAPVKITETAKEMLALLNDGPDVRKNIELALEIATGFFYAGENKEGVSLMEEIENAYQEQIREDQELNREIKFVYGLFAHDIDKNLKVIESAQIANDGYANADSEYEYLISAINLYDGYMGAGEINKARGLAETVDKRITGQTSLQVKDIHNICKGNVFLSYNRVMTALAYYEEGLKIAKAIEHEWDYEYGKIWRELALAYKKKKKSIVNLLNIYRSLQSDEYKYLKSLAGAFYFVALYLFNKQRETAAIELFHEMKETKFLGHKALVHAVANLLEMNCDKLSIQDTVELFLQCEGIKGGFTIANAFYLKYRCSDSEFQNWINKYVTPVFNEQKREKELIIKDLDNDFYVKRFCCKGCGAMCCYDGVYISQKEEEVIKQFMLDNKEYFDKYPNEIAKEEAWEDIVSGRKILTREFHSSNADFPAHFNNTMCIFAQEDGSCILQKVATDLDMHPWKIKPAACWLFPLDTDGDKVFAPPKCVQEDPNYIPEKYDGYVTALPCGQYDQKGTLWTDVYYNEIEYFYYLKSLK